MQHSNFANVGKSTGCLTASEAGACIKSFLSGDGAVRLLLKVQQSTACHCQPGLCACRVIFWVMQQSYLSYTCFDQFQFE